MATKQKANWQVELWMDALDIIEGIVEAGGYKDGPITTTAVASVLAAIVDEAYSVGLCVGAASKDKRVGKVCFRNQN